MKQIFTLIMILAFCMPVFADNVQPEQSVQLEKSYINKIKLCKEKDTDIQNLYLKSSFFNWITISSGKCEPKDIQFNKRSDNGSSNNI